MDGDELRKLRLDHHGWTQAELAKRSGVPRGTIANLEIGRQPNISIMLLNRLARAFTLPPERLYKLLKCDQLPDPKYPGKDIFSVT
jgi:transcriptional regulator with XRE-family HTH domain